MGARDIFRLALEAVWREVTSGAQPNAKRPVEQRCTLSSGHGHENPEYLGGARGAPTARGKREG